MPVPEESRWCLDRVLGVQRFPWEPTGTIASGHEYPRGRPLSQKDGEEQEPITSRGMPVLAKHLAKYGHTSGCAKCRAMQTGDKSKPTLGHNAACKERIRNLAEQDEEFRAQAVAGRNRTRREEEEEPEDEEDDDDRGPIPRVSSVQADASPRTQQGKTAHLSAVTPKMTAKYDVCEIFSTPRVTARARARGRR